MFSTVISQTATTGMAPTEMRRIGIDLDDRRLVRMELGGLDLGTRRAEVCI
jgi:hypothetical protein